MHNWSDGEVQSTYPLGDYKSKFGTVGSNALSAQPMYTAADDYRTTIIFTELIFTKSSLNLHFRNQARAMHVS